MSEQSGKVLRSLTGASLLMSASVPWMMVLTAWRNACCFVALVVDRTCGRCRRRPYDVRTCQSR
ncbi:MAG: hypothetical protein MUE50_04400 [Pirellulaceae bacterium]|nr:hypothetical protein [Pirellulaceae bacterium]